MAHRKPQVRRGSDKDRRDEHNLQTTQILDRAARIYRETAKLLADLARLKAAEKKRLARSKKRR